MRTSSLRRLSVAIAVMVAVIACSHDQNAAATGASASSSTLYPAGIVPPADWASELHAGIYSSDTEKTCCFLAGSPLLTLENPAGAKVAVFTFYVPTVKPLTDQPERVSAKLNGVSAGPPIQLTPGMQNVPFTIPPAMRQQRHIVASLDMSVKWIPKKVGLNNDQRELSVMLIRVGYI